MSAEHFKKERPLVRYTNLSGRDKFLLTTDANQTWFFLYDITSDPPKRIGKDKSPKQLEEKFKLNDVLRAKDQRTSK